MKDNYNNLARPQATAEGRKQKAASSFYCLLLAAFCFLLFAFLTLR